MILKLTYLVVIILAFFYPFISMAILIFGASFLIYIYYASSKKTKKELSYFKDEITHYFEHNIGDGLYHYNYVSKNSLYFLNPGASKLFKKILSNISIILIIVGIIYFFRFDNNILAFSIFCVLSAILIFNFSLKYAKPVTEYQIRNTSTFSNKARKGLEQYPEFFFHGEYARIKKEGNDKWMANAQALLKSFRNDNIL